MLNTRLFPGLLAGMLLALPASANTVWLKGGTSPATVCKNSLSSNPGQVIGYGGIDSAGNFTMTISNPSNGVVSPPGRGPCPSLPTTGTSTAPTPIVFTGSMPVRNEALNAIKAGTNNAFECLNQGTNLSGIGTAAGSTLTSGAYALTLKFTLSSDGCTRNPTVWLTGDGQPAFLRGATLTGGTLPFNGYYHVFNAAAIPEPDTFALLLAGATAALTLGWARRRKLAARTAD